MKESELERLVEVGDRFWIAFGDLAAHHIAQMPKHLEAQTITYLQDKCSIYNTAYRTQLEKERLTWQT